MKKEELIRYRAGLAALLVSSTMFLGGCAKNGFDFKRGEDNSYVVLAGSFINNKCIDKCYVVEAYNKLTEETELFLAKKYDETNTIAIPRGADIHEVTGQYFLDLMNNNNKLFYKLTFV